MDRYCRRDKTQLTDNKFIIILTKIKDIPKPSEILNEFQKYAIEPLLNNGKFSKELLLNILFKFHVSPTKC